MAFFRQSDLRGYAARRAIVEAATSFKEAKAQKRATIFLCHSHADRQLALGLKNKLREGDIQLYIDWEDTAMPETPNKETATTIKSKIMECNVFLFLATQNSIVSRWCPWEIGYADGKKPNETILIVPTQDDSDKYYGNEYLQLYSSLQTHTAKAAVFPPSQNKGWLFEDYARKYAK